MSYNSRAGGVGFLELREDPCSRFRVVHARVIHCKRVTEIQEPTKYTESATRACCKYNYQHECLSAPAMNAMSFTFAGFD
jgi:hypothetical protein